jgi:hypothetical protein
MDAVDEADDGDKIFKDPDDVVRGDGELVSIESPCAG